MLTAVQEGLQGALQRAAPGSDEGDGAGHGGSEEASEDSDISPHGVLRLCLTCHIRRAVRRARRGRKQGVEGGKRARNGQIAHLSSAVDH